MAKLTEEQKRAIVVELATYRQPSEVAEIVGERFGIKIDRRQVYEYDPDGSKGPDLAKKWKVLHAATRKQFLKDTGSIPVSNRAVRLRKLNDYIQKLEQRGNFALAAQMLEQAAKEHGDVFTNRQVVKHSGAVATFETTPDQLDAEIRALLSGANAPTGGS